jgi:hypothetical protein
MSDAEIPDRFVPAIRWVIAGIALFVFFLIAIEKLNEGHLSAGFVNLALFGVTFVIAVKWAALVRLVGAAATYLFFALTLGGIFAGGLVLGIFVSQRGLLRTTDAVGNVVWNFEQSASGAQYFLTMQRLEGEPEIRVISFGARGKNISDRPITGFNGTLRSEKTNETVSIFLLAQSPNQSSAAACFANAWIPTAADETFGIPAYAEFEISSSEKPFIETGRDGVPLSKFIRDFVPFVVTVEYGDIKYERRFTLSEVNKQVEMLSKASNPQDAPRITRKITAKPAQLAPLQTIIPQDMPKSPPGLASPIPPAGLPKLRPSD